VYLVAHVVPLDDAAAHTQGPDCVCGPRPEEITRADGLPVTQYVHASLDGRELIEQQESAA
jgi:hypothetical protein